MTDYTPQTDHGRGRFSLLSFWTLLLCLACLSVTTAAQPRRNGGVGATVFTDPGFRGESATFRGDTPDLRGYSLNDKISSITIPDGEVWEVCQDIAFGNRCQVLSNSVADLRSIGWNDRVSSLRPVGSSFRETRRGGRASQDESQGVVFYEQPGYRGSSQVVSNRSQNAGSVGSRARSMEVRGGTWELCDRTQRCVTVNRSVPDLERLGLKGRIVTVRAVRNGDGYDGDGRDERDRRDDPVRYGR